MSTPYKKFTFDTVFDLDDDHTKEDEAPEVIYTEQQYLAAMDQGRMVGIEAGVRKAQESVDNLASEALQAMAQRMGELRYLQEAALHELRAGSAQLSSAIAEKLAGALMQRQPQAEIEQLLSACIDQLIRPPRLLLHVSPTVLEILQERLAQVVQAAGYDGEVGLNADPALEITDCRIEWDNGGANFSREALAAQIGDVVDYYCSVQYDNQILPELPEDFVATIEPDFASGKGLDDADEEPALASLEEIPEKFDDPAEPDVDGGAETMAEPDPAGDDASPDKPDGEDVAEPDTVGAS